MPGGKKCEHCDKEATVYVTLILGGQVAKLALCRDHAEELGILDPKGYALIETEPEAERIPPGTPRCPCCGATQRDFERTGRLGCAQCYEAFEEPLKPILLRVHRGLKHLGKIPSHSRDTRVLHNRLEKLQHDLTAAVADERFEDAAVMRDEINAIRSQLGEKAQTS